MAIRFGYQNKKYVVADEAYDTERIMLPDCRVLQVHDWYETTPPVPKTMSILPNVPDYLEPLSAVAIMMRATLAEEVVL